MPISERTIPVRFTPRGLVDALDATDKFPGACISLSNLVFDQANPEIMVSRPGVGTGITSFSGFTTPGVSSVHIVVGTRVYGMISTGRNAGKDEPYSYNLATSTFDVISGVTNANTPTTQPTTGAWTPPTMTVVGTTVIVTHPGFPGGATKIGSMDISNAAAPAWSAGDVATNALPSVPLWVANFNNRAYYGCGQTTPFSDVLVPLTRTNATQVLTIGDTSPVIAAAGMPVQTTSSGVISSLLLFKDFQVWQVTGDSATLTLSLNFLSLTIGCSAPRSIAQSPLGTYFSSISGPYVVDALGAVKPITNGQQNSEPDIQIPFQNAQFPSRVAGGYSGSIYRACMDTIIRGTESTNDYWFDEHRRRWNGPHTFSYDCAAQYGNYFILSSNAVPGVLFKSQVVPDSTTGYSDNGTATMGTLQSSTFPKTGEMAMKQVIESTQELSAAGAATSYSITAQDDQQNTLNSTQISIAASGAVWGANVWGDGSRWASATNRPRVYTVPWTGPLVFQKMALFITATANSALAIGTFFARYKFAGYTNTPNP